MTTSPDTPTATQPKSPPPPRRWYRRWRVWLLATPLLFVASAITLHWCLSLGAKTTMELYEKFAFKADVEIVETAFAKRVEWALDQTDIIPGLQDFAREMTSQILIHWLTLSVTFDSGSQTTLVDEDFADLAKLKNVIAIDFADQTWNETRLKHLSRMTWLQQLSLDLSSLEEENEPTDEVTNAASPSPESQPHSPETLFANLHQIRQLKKLKLSVSEITPNLKDWIASQSALTELEITCNHASVGFLQTLAKLKHLTSLKLHAGLTQDPSQNLPLASDQQAPGKVLQTSRASTAELTTSNTPLAFPQLRHLWLCTGRNPGVEEIVHQLFVQNKQLTNLELGTLGLTAPVIADISALQNLTRLNLFSQKPLKAEHLRVATTLPRLTSLGLNGCQLEGDTINVINECKTLEELEINDTNLTDSDLQRLKTDPPIRWGGKSRQFNGKISLRSKEARQ